MKIYNSRIFTADVYMVVNSTVTKELKDATRQGDVFGSYSFEDRQVNKGVVMVYFGKKLGYVPVWDLKNIFDYIAVKINGEFSAKNFLKEDPGFMPLNGQKFIKNAKQLFTFPGKTSLTELMGIQKLQNDKDDTYSGGMEIM